MTEGKQQIRMSDDDDRRVLTRAWRGRRAIAGLERLCSPGGPRREFDATTLELADAFTGAAVREGIDRHLDRDLGHSVILREPRNPETLAMLHDLVGPLPRRARWAGEAQHPLRERHVLLPAMRVEEEETLRHVSTWLETLVSGPLRLPLPEARLLAMAAAAFGDNALKHGPDEARNVLLCGCHEPQGNDLQIVALSNTAPEAAGTDGTAYMHEILDRSRRDLGGLFSITDLARRRDIGATLRVEAGSGRLYCRDGRPRFESAAMPAGTFAASLEIHLRG